MSGNSLGRLSDVKGVRVGHAQTPNGRSGCTVIDFPQGAVAGIDTRGGGASTRQTDSLRNFHTVQRIDAICLSGGSALGLASAQGVAEAMREQGRGYQVRGHAIPIVPAAILFDLFVSQGQIPGPVEGRAAYLAATHSEARGSVGAGCGTSVGKWFGLAGAMRGGLGMASAKLGDITLGTLVVVNAFGDVLDEHGKILAGARDPDHPAAWANTEDLFLSGRRPTEPPPVTHTNLVVVATDAVLDREAVRHLAALAHNGVTITVRPAHLSFDGDVAFAAATGLVCETPQIDRLGVLATRLVAAAIRDAVRSATSVTGLPAATSVNRGAKS